MPDYLMRLQRGFAVGAVMFAIVWFIKRNDSNPQQKTFLITAFCGALAGIIILGVMRAMRKR